MVCSKLTSGERVKNSDVAVQALVCLVSINSSCKIIISSVQNNFVQLSSNFCVKIATQIVN